MSKLFLRTLRDDPAETDLVGHNLLVRAGYIRRLAPGIYSRLPLGIAILKRIDEIIREEMSAIGSQEVRLPILSLHEFFDAGKPRASQAARSVNLSDRDVADYLRRIAQDEMFMLLVRGEFSSYKDYPLALYQIQAEYRASARPRLGILGGHEVVVADSYSFALDVGGLGIAYKSHRDAYKRIFSRLGVTYKVAIAASGASTSEAFYSPAPSGDATFIQCRDCGYAATADAVVIATPPPYDPDARPPAKVLDTPDTPTIDTLVDRVRELGIDAEAADTLKNVVLRTLAPHTDRWELLIIGVPGDREVDLKRVQAQLYPAKVERAGPEEFAINPGLVKGYIGPQRMADLKIRYLVDPLVVEGSEWITGANITGVHAAHVVRGRDFVPDGVIGAIEVREGDRCACCGGALEIIRGIKLGHVSQLSSKSAAALGVQALGQDGKPAAISIGGYSVEITNVLAAIAEQAHDDKGLCWPKSVAPFDVHVVATGKDDATFAAAARLTDELEASGLRVLQDDRRGVSAGVKFKDAELIGIPSIVVFGRGLADGNVELRERRSDERREIPVAQAESAVISAVLG